MPRGTVPENAPARKSRVFLADVRRPPRRAPLGGRLLGATCPAPSPLGGCAPPARCGAGGARLRGGFPPLTTRGRRRAGRWEGPVLVERLERPDSHTVGHATSRDGRGFDGLEQFLLGGAVVDGAAHVGLHPILQAPGRQDPQHNQFLHFDGQRPVLAHTQAPDFRPGGGVGRVQLRGPVHLTVAIGIVQVFRLVAWSSQACILLKVSMGDGTCRREEHTTRRPIPWGLWK